MKLEIGNFRLEWGGGKRSTLDHGPDWLLDPGVEMPFAGPSNRLQVPGIQRPAENVLMVYGCLKARTDAIGGVPLRLADASGNLVESSPLAELLAHPNATQPWDQYVRVLEAYATLYDEIVIAKVRQSPDALPDELVPLSPSCLRPNLGVHVPTGTARAISWEYRDPWTGMVKTYLPEDLIIHCGFNPHAPLAALSPLTVLRRTMQGDIAAREQNLALFLNDSTPKLVLETDKHLQKQQADEVLEKWEERQAGFRNRHRTAVLWGGLKANKLGLTPAEMEYLAGLKFLRTDYYIVFRVKPAMVGEMIGETGLSQGSSTDQQKVEWWEDTGLAQLDLIAGLHQNLVDEFAGRGAASKSVRAMSNVLAQSFQRTLRRRASTRAATAGSTTRFSIFFDDNAIPALVRHRLGKAEQMAKLCGLGYRPDDMNDFLDLGLPPHPDNLGRVPFSATPIGPGTEEQPPEPAAAPPANQKALAELDKLERMFEEHSRAVLQKHKQMKAAFDRFVAPREKAAARKFSAFFVEQRKRVLGRMDEARARAGSETRKEIPADILQKIFPRNDEDGALFAKLTPLWTEHLADGHAFFNSEAGIPDTANPFTVDDPDVMAALDARKVQGSHINETTQDAFKDILGDAINEGATLEDLSESIAGYYRDNCIGADKARPMTAARTQTAGIVNQGRFMAAQNATGVEKGWLHGGSQEPRETHLAAQDKYLNDPIPIDQEFHLGNGVTCDYPGDPSLGPEDSCNCSCMVVFSKAKGSAPAAPVEGEDEE